MGEYLFIASAIFSVVNGTVLLCVNPRRSINRIYFATSIWVALWLSCVAMAIIEGAHLHDDNTAVIIFWLRMNATIAAFFGWYLWLMFAAILKDSTKLRQIVQQSWRWFIVCCLVATFTWSEYFIPRYSSNKDQLRGPGYAIYLGVLIVLGLWLFATAVSNSRRLKGIRKIEMQFLVFTSIGTCILLLAVSASSALFNISWLRRSGPLLFIGGHALAVWAICYYRVFDAKQLVLSLGQKATLVAALSIGSLFLIHFLEYAVGASWAIFLTSVVMCISVTICDRLMKRWLKLDPQYRIEKPRRHVIEMARQVANEEKLKDHFERLLREWFSADKAELVSMHAVQQVSLASTLLTRWPSLSLAHDDGWMTPETIQRKRAKPFSRECREFMSLNSLGAIVAVPKGSPNPSLIVLLGEKQSLRPYTFPDIQVLLELAELMDNILTHSRVATHAAQIERMASATMISRGLAHDLNNLATPVSSFLHHMDGRVTPGTVEAKVLADAKSSIKVMQDYIQESLFFARQLVPNLTVIQAHSVLSDVIRLSSERAREKNIHVITREGPAFCFMADFSLLRRLLQNLVFNGIDSSAKSGTIEISASVTDDEQVCLQVADQGSGIPPEVRSRIFEPYYTTKGSGSERRGLGLGLAICQKIAEIHGGRISVSANSPRGTIFMTTFPQRSAVLVMPPTIDAEPAIQDRRPAEPIHQLGPTQTVNGVYP